MKIVSANVKANPIMLPGRVRSDLRKLSHSGSVVGLQEIQPTSYKNKVREEFERSKWHRCHMLTATPVLLKRKHWDILETGSFDAHDGKRFVSPVRRIVWVVAKRKGTDKVVVFINTHFVSGAWNAKPLLYKQWRKERWNEHYAAMDNIVENFISLGYTVVGMGDFNRIKLEKFVKRQRWLSKGAIDYVFSVKAAHGVKVNLLESGKLEGHFSDHSPRWAKVTFTKGPGYKRPENEIPNARLLAQ